MARRIYDIDLYVVIKNRRVFGKNRDAALALQLIGIHHALDDLFIGAESAALAKHGVDERRFTVINVRDNGDVTDTRTQMVLFPRAFQKLYCPSYHFTMRASLT